MPLFYFRRFVKFNIKDLKDKIANLLNEILEEEYFVVEILFIEKKPTSKLTILLDGDNGINIEKCAKVSRAVSHKIEEENWIESAFVLEVSSPGIDRPLVFQRQYLKNIGRKLQITLQDGSEVVGILQNATSEAIYIEIEEDTNDKRKENKHTKDKNTEDKDTEEQNKEEQSTIIPLNDIHKANVLVSFN
jgi:ribosome maturation factor RimP